MSGMAIQNSPITPATEKIADTRPGNSYVADAAKQTNTDVKKSEPAYVGAEKVAESKLANQAVNDLAALAMTAYKDGRVADARSYWARLASTPEASSRSRALAHANAARTYCRAGDTASCEKFFRQALQADPSWRLSESDGIRAELQLAWRNALGK